jgi:tetratricopeptide (TPR) repeat protein
MDRFRVVQLRNPSNKMLGSGYLVRDNLILTSYHLFKGSDNKKCNICFMEDANEKHKVGWVFGACELIWFKVERDIALLQLNCDRPVSLKNKSMNLSIPIFGDFDLQKLVGRGTGFINYKDTHGDTCSKDINLHGNINRNTTTGEIELYLDSSLVPNTPTDWGGISGTALFANDYFIGIIKTTDGFLGQKVLCAIAISYVYEDPDFGQHVFAGEHRPPLHCITEEFPALDELLPPHNIPHRSGTKFIGRETDLTKLHNKLKQHKLLSISEVAISGMGGVGKTELALEYSCRKLHFYSGGICWISARSEESVGDQIVDFAKAFLKFSISSEISLDKRVRTCWREWQGGEVLVVFDDVDNYKEIKRFLPPEEPRFKVIITTRLQLEPPIMTLSLDILSEEESLDLLRSLLNDTSIPNRIDRELDNAKVLCQRLGYLPLGLELVGRYLGRDGNKNISVSDILRELQELGLDHPATTENQQTTAERGVKAAFDLTWNNLDSDKKILGYLLSLFAIAPISSSLIDNLIQDSDWQINPVTCRNSLSILQQWHLVKRINENTYQLHELIRSFFCSKANEILHAENFQQAMANLMVAKAKEIPDTPSILNNNLSTIPHLTDFATKMTQNQFDNTIDAPEIFVGLAKFYNGQGSYNFVKQWCDQGLFLLGTDIININMKAVLQIFKGKVLRVEGGVENYNTALQEYNQGIAALRDSQNPQHQIMVIRAWRGKGHVYRLTGMYDEALQNYQLSKQQAEAISFEKGEASAKFSIAKIYRLKGELENATNFYQEARESFALADLPVEENWAVFGIGEVQRMRWMINESGENYLAALKQFKKMKHKEGEAYAEWGVGDIKRLAASFKANNGDVDNALQKLKTARKNYNRSLAICQEINDERSAIWAKLGLAEIARIEGKYSQNTDKYNEALTTYQSILQQVSQPVERAHTLLGIAATKRLMGLARDSSDEITEALNLYRGENREMSYCIVDALIENALYYLSFNVTQSELDLVEAERICIDKNYSEERQLINKIREQRDFTELHILNFP